jgi:hypothetical protein
VAQKLHAQLHEAKAQSRDEHVLNPFIHERAKVVFFVNFAVK